MLLLESDEEGVAMERESLQRVEEIGTELGCQKGGAADNNAIDVVAIEDRGILSAGDLIHARVFPSARLVWC